jgi:SAM-dependent methyltransferase
MGLERFKPGSGANSELHSQHVSRYDFASRFVAGKRVVDVACGTGYGSALLRERGALSVTGIDLSDEAIAFAQRQFVAEGISFIRGDVSLLLSTGPAEVIVSFETIEHLDDPESLLIAARGILGGQGLFIVSTPVRHEGTIADRPANPYHVREWNETEFDDLLARHFTARRYFFQMVYRKRPWPLSRTINRLLLRSILGARAADFASFPVVERGWEAPVALVERGYIVAVCSGEAA